jgi:biotin transport system substrate-specific component
MKTSALPILCGISIMWISSLMSAKIFSSVPVTMQNCGVQVIAFFMSPATAFLSVLSWLASAAMGVPCLTHSKGGLVHVFGPTSGYLLGMLVSAPLMSFLIRKYAHDSQRLVPKIGLFMSCAISFLGVVVTLALGHFILMHWLQSSYNSWVVGVKPFVVSDMTKAVFGCLLVKGLGLDYDLSSKNP